MPSRRDHSVLQEFSAILVVRGLPNKLFMTSSFSIMSSEPDLRCSGRSALAEVRVKIFRSTSRFSSPKVKRLALLKPWGDAFHADSTANQL